MADPVLFDRASAERIASAVRKVEIGDRSEAPLSFRPIPMAAGGTKVKFAIWTATVQWGVVSVVGPTNTVNTKVIQFAFPTATQSIGTAVISVAAGPTAMCVNHLALMPVLTTNTAFANQVVVVMKEGGRWRLLGAQA
jgi:hypothetical protein